MNTSFHSKSLITSGWLRALLYLIALSILTVVIVLGYSAAASSNVKFSTALNSILSGRPGIITIMVFAVTLAITYIFRRWIDRKSFNSLGFGMNGYVADALSGAALGIFVIGITTLVLKLSGHLKWMDIIFDGKGLFLTFGSILIFVFCEELVFRGYILNNLMDSFPGWLALLITSFIFMLCHWQGVGFFLNLNTLIFGLLLGLNYLFTKNLWFSIFLHVSKIFFLGPVLGMGSQDSFISLLQTELSGDENITGGTNGLEGSFLLTGFSLLALIALYLILQKKFNQQSLPVPDRK